MITIPEIIKKTDYTNFYRLFNNIEDAYNQANIKIINGNTKRTKKIQENIINYIKENPNCTQRDINKNCKTHVQEHFKGGIIEAYKLAKVNYPYERLTLYGTAKKEIKKRARDFEEDIAIKLSGFGKVNKLVKTKRGVADIILERKSQKIVIEIKDYQKKEISISQIKQLNKYLEYTNQGIGILICHTKPKKDKFIIGKNKIFVIEKQELNKIPEILKGTSYNVNTSASRAGNGG